MAHKQLEEGSDINLDFDKLISISKSKLKVLPAVVQDSTTKEVLILGYVNNEALNACIETNLMTFWSTSRNELWVKGKTSGDTLVINSIRVNCEQNSLLFLVTPTNKGACHTKNTQGLTRKSCYYRELKRDKWEHLD